MDTAVIVDDDCALKQKFRGKIFSLCGLPGSGKGTQAELLSRRLGIIHISTGDLFRDEVRRETAVGKIISSFMQAGQFVPPEYANRILADRLQQPDTLNGVLLDGFPRNIDHLESLNEILSTNESLTFAGAIHLDLEESEAISRITGRRICVHCSLSYHIAFRPSSKGDICEICENELVQRGDDNLETVAVRLKVAKEGLNELLQEFYKRDQLLINIRSNSSPNRLASKLIELLYYPERHNSLRSESAYSKLQLQLDGYYSSSANQEEQRLSTLIMDFRDESLAENVHKRTGAMRRFVYVVTSNVLKKQEFERVFDMYGVEVLQMPPPSHAAAGTRFISEVIPALLFTRSKSLVPIAVLREDTSLLKPVAILKSTGQHAFSLFDLNRREWSSTMPGVLADHVSILTAWTARGSSTVVQEQSYRHCTHGRISLSTTPSAVASFWSGPIFGWDDKFEVLSTGKTYQEHRSSGLKISSRDMVLSLFLEDHIYYKQGKSLQHSDVLLKRPIDFDVDVADFVINQPLYNSPLAQKYGLCDALHHVLNEGIFFKAADTRIEANYWQVFLLL